MSYSKPRYTVIIMVALWTMLEVAANAGYNPRIPAGHSGKVVLHIDYGATPEKIRIFPKDEVHYEATGIEGMRVVGDRFYFIDDALGAVKCYRAPDSFLWQSEALVNLHYLAVAPNGTAYAAWGARVEKLSCISPTGEILWTADYSDLLSRQEVKDLGLQESFGHFGWLEWTVSGLTSVLDGVDENGQKKSVAVLIDQGGKSARGLPGFLVGPDGIAYSHAPVNKQGGVAPLRMVGKAADKRVSREVTINLGDMGQSASSKSPAFLRMRATPDGGFAAEGNALLSDTFHVAEGIQTRLEDILWVTDRSGALKQEWRILASPFGHRYQELSVQSDGDVYQLRYTEDGVDVLRYDKIAR